MCVPARTSTISTTIIDSNRTLIKINTKIEFFMRNRDKSLLQQSVQLRNQLKSTLFNPRISSFTGGDKNALLLLQLHYWLKVKGTHINDQSGIWYYSTLEQWQSSFPNWSPSSIRNSFKQLESLGLVISCQPDTKNGNHTKAYSIDTENFLKLLIEVRDKENRMFIEKPIDSTDVTTESERIDLFLSSVYKNSYNSILARKLGGDKQCLLLLQLHNWIIKCGKNISNTELKGLWIYNSLKDWANQFGWNVSTICKVLKELERYNLVLSQKVYHSQGDHTKWYSIDLENFNKLLSEIKQEQESYDFPKKQKMFFNRLQKSEALRCVKNQQIEPAHFTKSNNNTKNKTTNISFKENKNISKANNEKQISKNDVFQMTSEQLAIAKSLIEIWNEIMPDNFKVTITSKRLNKMYHLYEKHFDRSAKKWREYCLAINSSKFLMGEKDNKFKVYFDWIIREEQIARVRAKEFGVGDRVPDIVLKEQQQKSEIARENKRKRELIIAQEHRVRRLSKDLEDKAVQDFLQGSEQRLEKEFEKYLKNKSIDKKYFYVANQFSIKGWKTPGIQTMFKYYVLQNHVKKTSSDFVAEAGRVIASNHYL